jgi:Rieske Fe-S protein
MTSESLKPAEAPARRTVVAAVGAAGLAVALTACSSGDDSSSSSGSDTGSGSGASGGDTGSTAAGGGTALTKTADIPEGGGKIFKAEGVVVTQPAAGTYKAFSAKCTHRGCAVTGIADGVIVCPCHNSEFSVADGSVKKGPATRGLPEKKITVSGDSITLA